MAGTKKTTASKSKKVSKKVEPVVESEPVTETPVVESTVVDTESTAVVEPDEFEMLMNSVQSRTDLIEKEFKLLRNEQKKLLKIVQKKYNKKKKKSANSTPKAPSGFAKPAPISEELCKFLNKEFGTELARTEVTKELNKYIKANNLQDEKNKRTINPDEKLRKLLQLDKGQNITYFNLQKYMKLHFPKKETPTVTA